MNTKSALTFLTAIFLPFWLFSQNYGINFNGLNQYAASNTFSAYNSGSNVTIEFWVSLTASTGYTQFICDYHATGASGNDRKRIIPYIDGGTSKIGVWISPNISNDVGSLDILSNTVMTTNTWYHIAVTINSSKSVKLYINGVQASSGTLSAVFSLTGSEKLFMATDYWNSTNNYANIRLDEMRLWKEERSSANISTNMNLEVPTGSSNLMAYYRMTNGSGSTISDNKSTGTAIDATITNSATWSQPGAYPVLAYIGDSYSACYTNLKTAFDQINAGVHTGSITLKMSGSTTETATASLNKSGSGSANYSSVLIFPTNDNLTITGQVKLNGANNVTINGSKNASGTVKNLTIEYKDANNPALSLSSASNNVIKNLVIKSSSTGMSSGIVSLDASLGTAGSCYNRFDSCSFTKASNGRPLRCIYSYGSSTYLNTNNTVSNSNFYDFINGSVSAGNVIHGIFLQGYNDAWTINNNSFYETGGTISFPNANDVRIIAIQAETSNLTFTITNNKIGGSDASCGGTALAGTHTSYHRFSGINLFYGSYTLSNNVIKNISWTNTDLFYGITMFYAGDITCTGNQIGSETVNNSIQVSYNSTFNVYGIVSAQPSSGRNHIYTGNKIGGLSLNYTGSGTHACSFTGISEAYYTSCSNNLIGSTEVSNSITTPSSAGAHNIMCIRDLQNGGAQIFSYNTIANITNQSNSSSTSQFYGIYTITGTPTIQNNNIYNLKHSGSPYRGSYTAIRLNGSFGITCSGNTVSNLSLDNASGNGVVVGVYLSNNSGGFSTLSKNKIYGISSSSGLATLYGIYENSGKWNYDNNSISLGEENATGSAIYGIYGTPYSNLYFNSILIGGSVSSGSTSSTYALYCSANSAAHTFKNNLFVNARTGGTTGKHYAIQLPDASNLTINNNDYYSGSGTLGEYGGNLKTTIEEWRTATAQDANSVSTAVSFLSSTDLHLTGNSISDANLLGVPISGYTTDFDGVTRSPSSPTMGIHEVESWLGNSTDWSNVNNWRGGLVPTSSSTVSISYAALNQPHILNGTTALCRDISLNSGASLTIEPGGKLTVSGNFSNNGSVNIISSATGTGSLITNGTVTGSDFNIEQYLTPNKWHLISAPNDVSTANTFLGDYLQSWSESTAAWTDIIDPETPLSLMTGYTVYKSGSAATKIFEGTPATGNQSTTLSYHNLATNNDGMNLVGNPYPSAINWDVLQGTYGAAYIWDPSASSGAGDYLEWNANTGGNQNIAPMQGFFIYTATNGSSFQLTNNNRVHASGSYYKSAQGKLQNSLVLTGSNGIYEDEFILQFDDQANAGFELSRDAWKIISGGSGISQIYSISPDGKLAMDVRPFEKVISLGFSNDKPGTYTIALKQLTDLGNAVLEDTWNNTFTDLAKGAYTFKWQPSDDEQRFRLHMGALDIKVTETDPAVTVYSHNNTLYCSLADTREADIKVYSMAGQLLINRTNVSGIQQFQLASGAYVVIIVNETNTMVKKVIVR